MTSSAGARSESVRRPLAMSRRGLVAVAALVGALSSVVPVGAAVRGSLGTLGLVLVLCLWACSTWRVSVGLLAPPRPRWSVQYVDVPLTVVWASGFLGLPVALLGLGLQWLTGAAPSRWPFELGLLVGVLVAAWGVLVRRRWVVIREVELEVRGLAAEFSGYRIAQLSDLHCGSIDSLRTVRRWTHRTNELGCDLVVITGDLVTSGTRYYHAVARVLGELRATDGVYIVNGNHDLWRPEAWRRELEAQGLRVLRHEATTIRRGEGALVLVGLDAARSWDDARRVLLDSDDAGPRIVLAHYPDAYEALRDSRPALILSGHTHGGQLALPWIDRWANLTRLLGGPASGLRRSGEHHLYVSRGLGTTGVPLRLGAAPEITVLTLRAAGTRTMAQEG